MPNLFYIVPSGGAFTPKSISGLTVWLDGADNTVFNGGGTAVNLDKVGVWADKSTNNYQYSQATSAKKGTFRTNIRNGLSAVQFANAANGQWVAETAATLMATNQGFTFFWVANCTSFPNAFIYPFSWKGASVGASPSLGYSSDNSFKDIFWGCDTTWCVWRGISVTGPTSAWHYGTISYNGSGGSTTANFTANVDNAALSIISTAGNNGDTANMVGGYQQGAITHNFEGYIGEYIYYNRLLSANEQASVRSYLATKWGI